MLATKLSQSGRFRRPPPTADLHPAHLKQLRGYLATSNRTPLPIRPRGAGTAATDCSTSPAGTTLHTTRLDRIVMIDTEQQTVTVQAGVRVEVLVQALAEEGFELCGSYELHGRTVGGAIAAPCFGPGIGSGASYFTSHVSALKVVAPDGRLLRVAADQADLLRAFRMSFGLLGVIYEATLRIRPIRTFTATHRRVDVARFATIIDAIAASDVGCKFYLMPYRDRVYLDLRRYEDAAASAYSTPWRVKDWGESTVLPHMFRSLSRVLPVRGVKYNLMDSLSEATQNLVNTRLVTTGTNATSWSGRAGKRPRRGRNYSTWCFPAANFSVVVRAYQDFCQQNYAASGYRCDLPAVGYRLHRDTSAALSPSFDEAMIALTAASTQTQGWEDFVIDLAEFAEHWGGTPVISQSRALRAEHVIQTYAGRLDVFRRLRRHLDPDSRLLSPFLAQFCQ